MNPYRIYRDEWANALRMQVTSSEYTSFVAMPFHERFSYRSREILSEVICGAVEEANRRKAVPRMFAKPQRVDIPRGAVVITEEIVLRILQSHVFIADLTFQNAGVILETGVALGTKPNNQLILITQGSHKELHFDLQSNNVISYNAKRSVSEIADAMVAAARHFESQAQHYIQSVTRRLSPEAIMALRWYGELQRKNKHYSLHAQQLGPHFASEGRQVFDRATGELRDKDLLWTDYAVGAMPGGGDAFGMHATELGWAVIENMWEDLRRERDCT